MPHQFLVKDIALQSGLSTATVDRVLHGRAGVRAQTRRRVEAAIHDLERQEETLARGGAARTIDIVMEAPDRFSAEVRAAFEAEAGAWHPALFRPRFHFGEQIGPAAFARLLDRIRLRGVAAVVVKGPDATEVRKAVDRLAEARIPVYTLVTDLTGTRRLAYAGMDNAAAGETAAWLIAMALPGRMARVLVVQSSSAFRGEGDRVAGFAAALAARHKALSMTVISEGFGKDTATGPLTAAALAAHPDIEAVYSVGGGNRAILAEFDRAGRRASVFVAHDLDADNRVLLAERRIHFVLHHDLRADVRALYGRLLARRNDAGMAGPLTSPITVHTPFNAA